MDTEGKKAIVKNCTPRQFSEIMQALESADMKSPAPIDALLVELLKSSKDLTPEQVQSFFASVKKLAEDVWAPFLTNASIKACSERKNIFNARLILGEIVRCCGQILVECGQSMEQLEESCNSYIHSKDRTLITGYINSVRQQKSTPHTSLNGCRSITDQELACIGYACFTIKIREYSPFSYDLLANAERAIAEYFCDSDSLKDHAGKTLGNILASAKFSPKRIAALTYLYDGVTEQTAELTTRIETLKTSNAILKSINAELQDKKEQLERENAQLQDQISRLEAESAELREQCVRAKGNLEYERNKFERLLQTNEDGIIEQLTEMLEKELQAIRETSEEIEEVSRKRIQKRLQRIDDRLRRFGGKTNA